MRRDVLRPGAGCALVLFAACVATPLVTTRAAASSTPAGDSPTFHRDVAPLVHANCTACHRDGEAGPFPLVTYRDVRRRAEQVADVTARRVMPPWKAEPAAAGHFVWERRLTEAQIQLLQTWVARGCPEGDPADARELPKFPQGWQLGEPDVVVTMAEPYKLAPEGRDVYRCFVLPTVTPPAGKFLRAVEFRPGNRRVVHHAVLTTMRPSDVKKRLAAEPPGAGPGFRTGLAAPGDMLPGPLSIWVPGKDPLPLPAGHAMPWPAGAELVLQLHLHPTGKAEEERSSVGLYFTDEPPRGRVRPVILLNKDVDIAPGAANYRLTKSVTLPQAVDVIGLFPHMHLLGRTTHARAVLPDGTTRPLLSINDWDFRWQGYYQYATPVTLPAGTRVEAEWTFDNSANNPANPSNPPQRVRFGEQTTDEMGALIVDVIPSAGAAPPSTRPATAPAGPAAAGPLDGAWRAASAELAGEPLPERLRQSIRLTIAGGAYAVTVGGATADRGTLQLDPATTPKRLDATGTDGPNAGKTVLAIYDHDGGDALRVCYDLGGTTRPAGFASGRGTKSLLVLYRREQP